MKKNPPHTLPYSSRQVSERGSGYTSSAGHCLNHSLRLLKKLVLMLGAILAVLFLCIRAGGGSMRERRTRLVSNGVSGGVSGEYRVVQLNLDVVKTPTCVQQPNFTDVSLKSYQEYWNKVSDERHSCLLVHLALLLHDEPGSYVNIGSHVMSSTLPLMSHGHSVIFIDASNDLDQGVQTNYDKHLKEWQRVVNQAAGTHLLSVMKTNFHEVDTSLKVWVKVQRSPMIVLDIMVNQNSTSFEREFLGRLIKLRYEGVVVINGVYLNNDMRKLFDDLVCDDNTPYKAYDLAVAGNHMGMGLLDFEHHRQRKRHIIPNTKNNSAQNKHMLHGSGSLIKKGGRSAYRLEVGSASKHLAERADMSRSQSLNFDKTIYSGLQSQNFKIMAHPVETGTLADFFEFVPLRCHSISHH